MTLTEPGARPQHLPVFCAPFQSSASLLCSRQAAQECLRGVHTALETPWSKGSMTLLHPQRCGSPPHRGSGHFLLPSTLLTISFPPTSRVNSLGRKLFLSQAIYFEPIFFIFTTSALWRVNILCFNQFRIISEGFFPCCAQLSDQQ